MGKINRGLLTVIAMVAIMILAVGVDRGMKYYNASKWEKERVARYEMARADVTEIQMTISQLSQDQQAIEAFIEENKEFFEEMTVATLDEIAAEFQNDVTGNSVEDENDVSGNELTDISGNSISDISGNNIGDVSGDDIGDVSGNDISGNSMADISGDSLDISENSLSDTSGNFSQERNKARGSYAETILRNTTDLEVISENKIDFSNISITCLGDSITAATNLDSMEDYQQYSYPTRLGEVLGAKNVTNLGIGGSSIGRYWDNAFVDRYKDIPEDTELIIVMGGTNDGFCATEDEFGNFDDRQANTFIGDLDELMRGLKENYPDAMVVFATPLPNVLQDILKKDKDYLLSQTVFVDAIKQLAKEYEIPVIDLFNSNILNSHDAAVIYNYMPDGVHCNPAGYDILAQHFAAELIGIYATQDGAEEYDD